jgi:hypothetical protein
MATAIYQNGTIASADQCWYLITPIAAMAQTAMQQYYSRASPISGIPDASPIVFDIALIFRIRQRRRTLSFKLPKLAILISIKHPGNRKPLQLITNK